MVTTQENPALLQALGTASQALRMGDTGAADRALAPLLLVSTLVVIGSAYFVTTMAPALIPSFRGMNRQVPVEARESAAA